MSTKEIDLEQKSKSGSNEHISLPLRVLLAGDRRLDGEHYLTGGYAMRLQIETSRIPYVQLGELTTVFQPNRLKGTPVSPEHGVPYLTPTQTFDIRPASRKWLAESQLSNPSELYVKADWILVTRSGSVGDAIMSYSPHFNKIISDDLLRVQCSPEYQGYIYTFLRSRFGRTMLRSSKYGSIIKHLERDHLTDLVVPLLGDAAYKYLNDQISSVFHLRDKAHALSNEAELLYETEIGVIPRETVDITGYTIQATDMFSSRRLDGYHYNPTAQAVLEALKKSGKKLVPLSSVTDRVYGVPRFKHVYTDHGIPYLDSEDLFKINPELTKFIPEGTKKDAGKYYVKRDWLLMACSGQIYGLNGSVVLADTWHENKIVSNHVIRIVPSSGVRSGYLQMALGHPVYGRSLVIRLAMGTSVPEITPEDLVHFPIPRLAEELEIKIAEKIESASHLRMKADDIENEVVKWLENRLEHELKLK